MNFPLSPRFQAVLFDMDGTLLDTLSDMQDAVNHILLENGWPQRTLEEIRAFVGNGAAKLMERAIPEPIAPQRFHEILVSYKDWYQAHNCVKTAPYPGVPPLSPTSRTPLPRRWRKSFSPVCRPSANGTAWTRNHRQPLCHKRFQLSASTRKMPCMWATAR